MTVSVHEDECKRKVAGNLTLFLLVHVIHFDKSWGKRMANEMSKTDSLSMRYLSGYVDQEIRSLPIFLVSKSGCCASSREQ